VLRSQALRVLSGPDSLQYLRDELAHQTINLIARIRGIIYAILMAAGRPIPKLLEHAYDVSMFAARRYRPIRYSGFITLFRATWGKSTTDKLYGYELGWKDLAGSGVEVHEIPGTHLDMVREPNVQFLAREVIKCLARARDRQLRDSILMTPKQRADREASSRNAISAADERVPPRNEPIHARSV